MKRFDVFRYHEYYTAGMYSERNRIKNFEAVEGLESDGLAVLIGRPINRKEGAASLQKLPIIVIGCFEMILLNPDRGPYLHIQADVRRADGGNMLERLKVCINWEKTRAANAETHYIRFLLKERA
jgi:hypothetical protein